MISLYANLIILILILVILAIASLQDIKRTTIGKYVVIFLYILVPISLYLRGAHMLTASFCFMFTLAVFLGLWFLSRGGFGMGDVLLIGSLGWLVADWAFLQAWLIVMGVMSIPWGLFWAGYYARKPEFRKHKSLLIGKKKIIPVGDLCPGMVCAHDNFMQGLTAKDIQKIKDEGKTQMEVKQPFPFVPVITASYFIWFVFPSVLVVVGNILA
jgi:hypothetical protein